MNLPATMRALQQPSLDGPQHLRLINDAPVPEPAPHELLIRVRAAGVNFGDILQARGKFLGGPQPPYLAGFEAAGEIVKVGEAVSAFEPGLRVVGVGMGAGAFAEYAALPAVSVMPLPEGWSEEQALGLMVNWPTALAAIRQLGRVAAGETVLIHAAAGGTGQAAVRIAKHYGATVIAAAAAAKHEIVRALGADHLLDSRSADTADEVRRLTDGHGADLVLEVDGDASFEASLAAAKRVTGRVVVYGSAGGDAAITNWDLIYRHQVQITGLNIGILAQSAPQVFGQVMQEMFALIGAGVLTPSQPTAFQLDDGPRALSDLEARTTVGKLALVP